MIGILTHKNGRLRTGRVAILIFVGLLVCLGTVFKMSRPIDEAIVQIRHVFEPEELPTPPEEKGPHVKQPIEGDRDRMTAEVNMDNQNKANAPERTADKQQSPPIKQKAPEDLKEKASPEDRDQKPNDTPIVETKDLESENKGDPDIEKIGKKVLESVLADPDALKPKDSLRKRDSKGTELDKSLISEGMEAILKNEEPIKEEQRVDLTAKLDKLIGKQNPPVHEKENRNHPGALLTANVRPLSVDRSIGSITVGSDDYMTLYRGWQTAGGKFKGDSHIPLRVENLRNVYELFQMKPVVVLGDRFIDLNDGTLIPKAALEEYSSTVFLVDQPWEKWGTALKKAGIGESERLEVRYYMYGFIRDAIYARVEHCFEYCKAGGLIPPDAEPGGVDVLGRAYVINRKGGGRFGVFVPVSLTTRDGRSFNIDPDCFKGQPDVEALRVAGLL